LYMFTVSVILKGRIYCRYYKRYLQYRLICDLLEISQTSATDRAGVSNNHQQKPSLREQLISLQKSKIPQFDIYRLIIPCLRHSSAVE